MIIGKALNDVLGDGYGNPASKHIIVWIFEM